MSWLLTERPTSHGPLGVSRNAVRTWGDMMDGLLGFISSNEPSRTPVEAKPCPCKCRSLRMAF